MRELILNEQQMKLVSASRDPIRLVSDKGEVLGVIHQGFVINTPEDEAAFIEQMKRRRGEPRTGRSTEDVLMRLKTWEAASCPSIP